MRTRSSPISIATLASAAATGGQNDSSAPWTCGTARCWYASTGAAAAESSSRASGAFASAHERVVGATPAATFGGGTAMPVVQLRAPPASSWMSCHGLSWRFSQHSRACACDASEFQTHVVQFTRPRGRVNCTTWVWNSDASHAQARECWLKRHDSPWQDIQLLAGGARSWTTGIAVPPPKVAAGVAPTTRSCADAKAPLARLLDSAAAAPVEAYQHRAVPHVHGAEESFCPPVAAAEASVAIEMGDERVRIRLNRATSPQATAWIDSVIDHGACANASRRVCDPHCCNFYRGEAVVGYHRLPDELLRAHSLDPAFELLVAEADLPGRAARSLVENEQHLWWQLL